MKHKLLASVALAMTSLSSWSFVQVQNFDQKTIYDFSVDGIQFEQKNIDGDSYHRRNFKGVDGFSGIHYQVGAPELPVLRFQVAANSEQDIQVSERYLKSAMSVDASALKPVFDSVEKVAGATYQKMKSLSSLNTDSYSIKEVGSVRGVKQFLVTLYPVALQNGQLSIVRSYGVEVNQPAKTEAAAGKGLVFVVGQKFKKSASLASYVSLKQSEGYEVDQIDVKKGMSADEIRAQVKALYTKKPQLRYVIIVGDSGDVTGHDSTIISGTTDHYYASIDTNDYASDILSPDLQVGRISVANESQLAIVVEKYSRYIKGDFTTMNWLSQVSFLATDDRYEVAEGTHNYVIDSYTKSKGYKGSFPEAEMLGGDKLYAITYHANTKNVMDSLLKGRSIVNYSGHGATTYWAGPEVDQDNVRSLTYSSLPFVISNACITGDFTIDESFAETWQRLKWGAILFWGSMDSTYWDEDDILERRMYDGIFKDNLKQFGDITHHALKEMSSFYNGEGRSEYYWETYHMFGDPSIGLRL